MTSPTFRHAAVSSPIVTPFDAGGDVDADALASHVETLVDAGLDGIVPCGTTGEFASLTDAERRTAIETTVEAAGGRVPVIAGAADTMVAGDDDRALTLHRRGIAPLFGRCGDHGFAPVAKIAAAHRGFIPDPAVRR